MMLLHYGFEKGSYLAHDRSICGLPGLSGSLNLNHLFKLMA